MSAVQSVQLNNGVSIPQLGLGVFQIPPAEVQQVVEFALESGYRHIDTAAAYNNEAGVGAALKASGLKRSEVFITSKLRNGEQGYESAQRAYFDSCGRLGVDQLDLYLIHWPNPSAGRYLDSWRALERLSTDEQVRAIGVSNFTAPYLDELLRHGEIVPAVNQIELHPTYQQRELVRRSIDHGIAVQAYSPLGQGADLDSAAVREIAAAHQRTPAQVVLRWHLQRGHIVIPKSASRHRIIENLQVTDFELSPAELDRVTALEAGNRIGNDPAAFALSQIR
jgi:2,5-diketo-D-gluconate reductase A